MLKPQLALATFILTASAFAHAAPRELSLRSIPAGECNERIRKEVIRKANERCNAPARDLFWSEKEVDVSPDLKTISGAFSFECPTKKRYLGLIKIKMVTCELLKTEISHTSPVPTTRIREDESL